MDHKELAPVCRTVVLDTNIVLDLYLFQDPCSQPLKRGIESGQLQWIATQHMRNELERVLTYAHIAAKIEFYATSPAQILAKFDQYAQLSPEHNTQAPCTCKDPDDQAFIDLAASLAASQTASDPIILISKDKAVLSMRKSLEKLTIRVTVTL
jgi:predicted nucleic acid-binding protein